MILSIEDAELFYKLNFELQFYANIKKKILPSVNTMGQLIMLSEESIFPLRDAVWNNTHLIEEFVKENPGGLPPDELEIVGKWKNCIVDSFFIYRYLKTYTVFVGEQTGVYAVLGLVSPIEEIFLGTPLPILVKAVLLPFKGQIIYDGIFQCYNLVFGAGICRGLKEDYLKAKENGKIITSLDPGKAVPAGSKPVNKLKDNWGEKLDEIAKTCEAIKDGSPVQKAAIALLKAGAKLAQSAANDPGNNNGLWESENKVIRAINRFRDVRQRMD